MNLEKICLEIVKLKYRLDDEIDRKKKAQNEYLTTYYFSLDPDEFMEDLKMW